MYTRVIQRLISIAIISLSIIILTCVSAAFADIITGKEIQTQSLFQPKPKITAEIPHNPNLAKQIGSNPGMPKLAVIDRFAWQSFLALNWPADCQQGAPLQDKKIGEAPNAPRVWEFYRTPETVFLEAGNEPPTQPTRPLNCQEVNLLQAKNSKVQLTESGKLAQKDRDVNPANVPLVDQQGNYIIVETYINPREFDQIVKNKWYDAVNLAQFSSDNFALVCSENENGNVLKVPCSTYEKEGAIEVKAAWRVFDEPISEEEKARYYTTKRKLSIPAQSDNCDTGKVFCSDTGEAYSQVVEVGLIGFHIKQKTSEQGWIWSTFEQVDNVPDGTPTRDHYTLYNPNCGECKPNDYKVTKAPYFWQKEAPHAVTMSGDEIENQLPSQIVRSPNAPLASQRSQQNEQWHEALKDISRSSVWQYYKLIGTQWLTSPSERYNTAFRDITPNLPIANVTLEPYVQTVNCIDCHTGAKLKTNQGPLTDFSFQIARAKSSNSSAKIAE